MWYTASNAHRQLENILALFASFYLVYLALKASIMTCAMYTSHDKLRGGSAFEHARGVDPAHALHIYQVVIFVRAAQDSDWLLKTAKVPVLEEFDMFA